MTRASTVKPITDDRPDGGTAVCLVCDAHLRTVVRHTLADDGRVLAVEDHPRLPEHHGPVARCCESGSIPRPQELERGRARVHAERMAALPPFERALYDPPPPPAEVRDRNRAGAARARAALAEARARAKDRPPTATEPVPPPPRPTGSPS